jgi:hypothetical protein
MDQAKGEVVLLESVEDPSDQAAALDRPWDQSRGGQDGQPQPEGLLADERKRTRATRLEQALAGATGSA